MLCFVLTVPFTTWAQQTTMTDEQILAFITNASNNNMTRSQIITQLIERGVSVERIQNIRKKYQLQKDKQVQGARNISGIDKDTQNRLRQNNAKSKSEQVQDKNKNFKRKRIPVEDESTLTPYQQQLLRNRRAQQMDEELGFILPDSLGFYDEEYENYESLKNKRKVFGRDIFNNKSLTFEPEMNIATPTDYSLGPGDAVFVDVWGASQKQYTATVSPEGSIDLEDFGPVQISGMTVAQANAHLRSTLGGRFGGSNIRLTVGQTKTITVNVMGEVNHPGTYTLSAFATVFHALYMAGGTNETGTMRAIKVYRNNRLVSTIDLYDYILNGNLRGNVRLATNDVIVVGPYECLVNIVGKVRRPMFYEMKASESVATLIKYAGGFTGDAYEDNVLLTRKTGGSLSVYTLNEFERGTFHLADADSLFVDSVLNRYKNMVELRGAVRRPGQYQMDGTVSTIRQLIETAGGLTEEALTTRGIIHRRKDDRTLSVESFNVAALLNHQEPDQALKNEDVVFIPSRKELNEELSLRIEGEVRYPGTYDYAENATIESLILQAGGLTDKASLAKVDVARRIRDKKALKSNEQVAQFYSFSVKDGFVIDGQAGFALMPFDEVFVRSSPGYVEQEHVYVEGEIEFAGTYAITKKNYRLSDLVKAAGGLSPQAYLQGARLQRVLTQAERQRKQELLHIITSDDSTNVQKLAIELEKSVGINLDMALNHPGNDSWDIILQEGDRLIIPQFDNTVTINGEVMLPNTVAFKPGSSLSHYINQCGGYGQRARKNRIFAIHKNGTVSRVRSYKDIQPGSTIVVPAKKKRSAMPIASLLSLSMTLVTLAAVIVNAFKK